MKKIFSKLPKSLYILFACQAIILLFALGSYVLNRGQAFQKVFTLDEYQVADCTKVVEDVTVDETSGYTGVFLTTPELELDKGIYQVQIHYNADRTGNMAHVSSAQLNTLEFHCPSIELEPSEHTATMILDISRDAEDIIIETSFSGAGYLSITGVSVYETSSLYKKNIFHAFVLCILFALIYKFRQSDTKTRQIMLALGGIFLVSCYPLYTDYLVVGHDIPFHLLRIEGIQTGLSQGVFPVKIHPVWAKDYGYAVGVFYGDLALYFPAFLRLLGFSVQTAYKYFVAAMNLGTILLSYYSFKKMFHSRKTGLIGCLAYTMSLYRLVDVYTRASVGEYTAMMFLPLVLLGFYLIFCETDKSNWWKHSIIAALGLSGLVQSHVLSCEMVLVFILLGCIILIRKVCTKYIFASLTAGAGLTVLLNIGFLIPFLDMYQSELYINSDSWIGSSNGTIQTAGMFPLQLFSIFQSGYGGSFGTNSGVMGEVTVNVGIFILAGMTVFLYLLLCHNKACREDKNYYPALICFTFGCLSLWMSSCYFPWDAIADTNELFGKLVVSLEFPWRFLAMATVFLTFTVCFAYQQLEKAVSANTYSQMLVLCAGLLAVNCGWYFYDYYYNGAPYRVYETYEINSMQMYSYDYLPVETYPDNIQKNQMFMQGVSSIDGYQKMGTKILCHVVAEESGGTIEFPLNYYKYYQCHDIDTGASLEVSSGYNGMVKVDLPEGYSSNIQVSFQSPWFWRVSEAVSAMTLLLILVLPLLPSLLLRVGRQRKSEQVQ